jgi:glycosyltransferase involved in cell wall biosynthesis
MSVVFINQSLETFTPTESGAIATHVSECCYAAQRAGGTPVVISRSCKAAPFPDIEAVFVDYPPVPEGGLAHKLYRIQRKLTGWRHLRQQAFGSRVVRAIRRAGLQDRPLILHNDPELAVLLRRRFPDAFIVHHFHNQIDSAPIFRRRLPTAVNAITAVSAFTSRWIEQCYGLTPNSVRSIYNGVDAEHFTLASSVESRPPVINFVGRTGIEKAPDLVLKAALQIAGKVPPFSVQILGSNHWNRFELDDYQRELKGLAEQLEAAGIPVRRPGHISRTALPEELRRADIHVVPSRWDEPFALTILEGMACGLATVASRTGGAPEVVGDAGLLFERDSVEGLAAILARLISEPALRADYARRARARAEEFAWDRTWEGFQKAAGLKTHHRSPACESNQEGRLVVTESQLHRRAAGGTP